jgi:hypothetical protein
MTRTTATLFTPPPTRNDRRWTGAAARGNIAAVIW